jgi:Chromosome segregation ATPases
MMIFFVFFIEAENESKILITKGKEHLQCLAEEKEELQNTIKSLQNQQHEVQTELSCKEESIESLSRVNDALNKNASDLEQQNNELRSSCQTFETESNQQNTKIEKLQQEIGRLEVALKSEKTSCQEERSLCKSAYERESKQREAQENELVKCLKALQAENHQLNKTVDKLNDELANSKKANTDEKVNCESDALTEQKVHELQLKLDKLKMVYEEELETLGKEKELIETKTRESESKLNVVREQHEETCKELAALKKQYGELLATNCEDEQQPKDVIGLQGKIIILFLYSDCMTTNRK